MHKFFSPNSVAVTADFGDPNGLSTKLIQEIVAHGYTGKLYPVSAKQTEVAGVPAVSKLDELPLRVDLFILPTDQDVVSLLRRLIKHGAQRVLLAGPAIGASQQEKISALAESAGVKLFGPTMMISHTGFAFRLGGFPHEAGRVALFGRGDISEAILSWAHASGVGLSHSAALGSAGVDESELLDYLITQSDAEVVACYFTTVSRPRLFLEAVRRVAAFKPVVVYLGLEDLGRRHILSRELMMRGAVVAEDLEDFMTLLQTLAVFPPPISGKISLIGIGPTALNMASYPTADLEIVGPSAAALPVLRRIAPGASVTDVVGLPFKSATALAPAVRLLLEDTDSDIVMVCLLEGPYDMVQTAIELANVARRHTKSVVASVIGGEQARIASQLLYAQKVAVVGSLERAMSILGRVVMARYQAKRPQRYSRFKSFGSYLSKDLGRGKKLTAQEMLRSYGLATAPENIEADGSTVSIDLVRDPELGPTITLDGVTLLAPLEEGVAELLIDSLSDFQRHSLAGERAQLAVTLDRLSRMIWEIPVLDRLTLPQLTVSSAGLVVEKSKLSVSRGRK
jgi:acetyltransferase